MIRVTFRSGFIAGVLVAVALGGWLYLLWQPERQIELHSFHLLEAIEEQDWGELNEFLADTYQDQWAQDRALALTRLQAVIGYTRNARIETLGALPRVSGEEEGSWSARISFDADPNEVSALIKARVNALDRPWELTWRRQSWKPWDWQLVHVSNPALELPTGMFP